MRLGVKENCMNIYKFIVSTYTRSAPKSGYVPVKTGCAFNRINLPLTLVPVLVSGSELRVSSDDSCAADSRRPTQPGLSLSPQGHRVS